MSSIKSLAILTSILFLSLTATAMSDNSNGFDFGLAMTTSTQDDLNGWLKGQGAQTPGNGTEFTFSYIHRFQSSMYALVLRPSYFTQSSSGTASANLTGLTFYPELRLYPLENNFIHFFMQVGFGYGSLSGTISNGAGSATFSGNAFGAIAGLGAEFCFTSSQCMSLEGDFRYNPIPRSIVSASSGALGSGITRQGVGQELEYSNADVQNSLSGVVGQISYSYRF